MGDLPRFRITNPCGEIPLTALTDPWHADAESETPPKWFCPDLPQEAREYAWASTTYDKRVEAASKYYFDSWTKTATQVAYDTVDALSYEAFYR